MADQICYSAKYYDDEFEYRSVRTTLPPLPRCICRNAPFRYYCRGISKISYFQPSATEPKFEDYVTHPRIPLIRQSIASYEPNPALDFRVFLKLLRVCTVCVKCVLKVMEF